MPYIPQEILDIIINHADRPDFSNCASLVSHSFHQIVLPYKFRSLTFQNRNRAMGKKFFYFDSDTVPKLCEAINVRDAHALSLAPLVPELILLVRLNPPDLYEKNINGVRNIIKLNMQGCSTCLAFMEQLGKLVQLQSLHTWYRVHAESGRRGEKVSYGALSNLQSLHTPECRGDGSSFSRYISKMWKIIDGFIIEYN